MATYVWGTVGILFLLAIWAGLYFFFVGWEDASIKYFAPLRRRHALVAKMIESAKGASASGMLDAVGQALSMAKIAAGLDQTAQTEHALSGALRELFAHANTYAALKTNQDFQQLQAQIVEIEPEINAILQYCTAPRRTTRPW